MTMGGAMSLPAITTRRARAIFEGFDSVRVIVLGDVMLDVYLYGHVDRISPEAPVPVLEAAGESIMMGGAANVAGNIAALGADPLLIGVVGEDEAAGKLRGKLKELGIRDEGLIVDESRPTTRKTRILADNQQVVRVDREDDRDIEPPVAKRLLSVLRGAIRSCDALLFQDYNKGTLTPAIIEAAIAMACEEGKIVTVDPKFRNFFEYRGATLFKPNLREMEVAFGSVHPSDRGLEKMMLELKDRLGSSHVLLTCGEEGMTLLDEAGEFHRIPAVCREVFDVSGAGDTVISTVTLALAAGGDVRESSILANYAAAVEVQRAGVRTVTREEVIEAIRRDGGRRES